MHVAIDSTFFKSLDYGTFVYYILHILPMDLQQYSTDCLLLSIIQNDRVYRNSYCNLTFVSDDQRQSGYCLYQY